MLNATELHNIADASKTAKDAKERARIRELTDEGLKYVRDQLQERLISAANNGHTELYVCLGPQESSSAGRGLFYEFLNARRHHKLDLYPWVWSFKNSATRARNFDYPREQWPVFVNELLGELRDADFEVACRPHKYSQLATREQQAMVDLSPATLACCPLQISW